MRRLLAFLTLLIPSALFADPTGPSGTYIYNQNSPQAGAKFNVSSGTARTMLQGPYGTSLPLSQCLLETDVGRTFTIRLSTSITYYVCAGTSGWVASGGGGSGGSGVFAIGDATDVDDSARAIGSYLCFDGTNWVAVSNGGTCSFSIATFSNGLSATQEIGSGVWKTTGTISFTASYNNGPPTSSTVTFSGWSDLYMSSPFTSTTSIQNVNYPAVAGTVVFTLNSKKGSTTDTETITHTFVNRRFWGVTTVTSGFTEANVEALSSELSNSKSKSFSSTASTGEYLIWASPTRLGTVTFEVGGFEGGYQSPETVSITNSSGYAENYYVYRSVNSNLGTVNIVTE